MDADRQAQARRTDVIIVVCSGCREDVRACLQSLNALDPSTPRPRVTVVDNASTDGTANVAMGFDWVDYVRLPDNRGFSTATNVGIRRGRAPYVLLLNPDTEVPRNLLAHLVDVMEEQPDLAVVGSRLVDRTGASDHNAKRTFPTPASAFAYFAKRLIPRLPTESVYATPWLGDLDVGQVDAVSGACMFVRRAAIEQVGLLDEKYWMYGEDLDWCYRFRRVGWGVLYDGRITVLHHKGGATGRHRPFRVDLAFHLSMGRFYRKFLSGQRPVVDGAVYAAVLAKLAVSALHNAALRWLTR